MIFSTFLKKRHVALLCLGLVVLSLVIYFIFSADNVLIISNSDTADAPIELSRDEIIKRVGKLVDIEGDERPTIATVTDPERLRDQPFFAKAKKGDKVLI